MGMSGYINANIFEYLNATYMVYLNILYIYMRDFPFRCILWVRVITPVIRTKRGQNFTNSFRPLVPREKNL